MGLARRRLRKILPPLLAAAFVLMVTWSLAELFKVEWYR